jgi:hypothetical protein
MTESEYVAATHGMQEALWLHSIITEFFQPYNKPVDLFCNSQSAIALTRDHQYHSCMKHIDAQYHFIRWVVEEGCVCLIYCPTQDMVANVFTKALPSTKAKHFADCLRLWPI